MNIENIVEQLQSELTRIGQAIGLLEGNAPAKKRVGRPPTSAVPKARSGGTGHGLTPAGRRKLSLAMKARWAKRKGAKGVTKTNASVVAAPTKLRKPGGITAAGRKRLSEAMKARWAAKKRKG